MYGEYGADHSLLEAAEARSEVLQEVIEALQAAIADCSYETASGLHQALRIVQEMDQ